MNHKQKLGYTLLGAGILALGIVIGQFVTPDIKAQLTDLNADFDDIDLPPPNRKFNKITCRELEIVDKNGKRAIKLSSGENFRVGDREGILNRVAVYSPLGEEAIILQSEAHNNGFSVQDQKVPNQSAFWMFSSNLSNYSARWIREHDRVADW